MSPFQAIRDFALRSCCNSKKDRIGAVNQSLPTSRLLDYLRLFRIPNVFTAVADIAMGFLLVQGHPTPVHMLVCLVGCSALIYTAGMVLNDVFDIDIDLRERPERPLPAGRISLRTGRWLGFGMLLAGVLLGGLAGAFPAAEPIAAWRPGVVAGALAAAVIAYDAWLKRTPLGPLGMASCRFLNVLLGASVAVPAETSTIWTAYYDPHPLVAAAGLGIYILGVTWFARSEAQRSNRLGLALATAVMLGGIFVLGLVHTTLQRVEPARELLLSNRFGWALLLTLLSFVILRRCVIAIVNPSAREVQLAVKNCILSVITLDAAVAFDTSNEYCAGGVLLLLVPTLILGRWVYST